MLKEILKYINENIEIEKKLDSKKVIIDTLNFKNKRAAYVDTTVKNLFKKVPYKEEFYSYEAMLYNQMVPIANNIFSGDDTIYGIRANYGVGTLASFFGAKNVIAHEDSLPWCEHLPRHEIDAILERGVPSFDEGFGKKITETYEFYIDALKDYENIKAGVEFYHPDFQGPFDTTHLLFGNDMYYEFYDEPQTIHDLQNLVSDTYIRHMKKILADLKIDRQSGYCQHWTTIFKGNIVLRNDTSVSVSDDMYREFVMPYDKKVIEAFNGAAMHYCGERETWLKTMLNESAISSINFGEVPNKNYGAGFLSEVKQHADIKSIPVVNYTVSKEQMQAISQTDLAVGTTFVVRN